MVGTFVPPGRQRFVNPQTGDALIGGQVFMYIPSTDTPKDTWSDQAETSLNTNPIILDGFGECEIWGEGLYRQKLLDALGNEIWDQITGFLGGGGPAVVFATPAEVAALSATDLVISPYALGASGVLGGGGGGTGYGSAYPLSLYGTLDLSGVTVGSNDTILAAAEADAVQLHFYVPQGVIRTNLPATSLTKGYKGDGAFISGPGAGDGAFRPPNFTYMAVKPSTWPVQGAAGFFRGDQRFTDSGEWKIIGPNVRTYDLTSRYFESNTIPHFHWFDTFSGNSGVQGYLFSGAAAGATVITISGPATLEWIGKTVAFSAAMDGIPLETRLVTNVSGNTITVSPGITNTYTWNPLGGLTPCIFFGHRTSASVLYIKSTDAGGGDNYQHVLRQNVNYVPKGSEYHTFMAATGGNLGGDIYANANGVFLENQEWQIQGQSYDIAGISYLSSLTRAVDYDLANGKIWMGTYIKADGGRPSDVAHGVAGTFRNAMDTGFANLYETSRLTVAASASATTVTVASVNGAHPNDTFVIGSETHTIQTVNAGAKTVTLTTGLIGSYGVDTLVTYPMGGAVLNMAKGQRFVWNSTVSQNARGGDPTLVYSAFYGNVQGDMITDSGVLPDGTDYLAMRIVRGTTAAAPDIARIRVKGDAAGNGIVQMFGTGVHSVRGAGFGLAAGTPFILDPSCQQTWGTVVFDCSTGHFRVSVNGGASFTTII